jgi:hypothetical protein
MTEPRIPDPTLMARLQLSAKGVDWAASLVRHRQHEELDGEWSANRQVFHLLATEKECYGTRLQRMLNEERPRFESWDSDGYVERHHAGDTDIEELARQFMGQRERHFEVFRGLTREQWQRTATWPDGREVDVAWMAEKMLWHGLHHFASLLELHGEMEPLQARG